ncbi:transcriptional regulator [Cytobacillus kochii]|uniref:helix-turn-helix transcriptional regulator n=1 Tax=Cytobacillus TaxID=2675230 RepID=UPI002E1B9C48|nr:transcriptional regulator [Cytobacillus kochii]
MEFHAETTKDKVLFLLKKESSMSVNDLKERLNISHMAVRKHLTGLENSGLIASIETKQALGRPTQFYYLTSKGEHSFPKNYEGLSLEFLNDIEELYGSEAIENLFMKREKRLVEEYENRLLEQAPDMKMQTLLNIQNEKGYMAYLSKTGTDEYELTEFNCPILSIAQSYKTACHCETQLFKQALNTNQVHRVRCKTEGHDHCQFKIKFN